MSDDQAQQQNGAGADKKNGEPLNGDALKRQKKYFGQASDKPVSRKEYFRKILEGEEDEDDEEEKKKLMQAQDARWKIFE
jgi:hypothetical protein